MNKEFENDILNCIDILKNGGIFLYPTDTIWGIGCDAADEKAVAKIYEVKERVFSKSMIILVDNVQNLRNLVDEVPEKAIEIIEIADNPTTIIYQNAKNLAPNVIAEDGSVGIRIPNDDFCVELIKQYGKPIVSTSANISGEDAPQNFSEISEKIKNKVDYIVKWRQNDQKKAKASTIILIEKNGELNYIRK
jgi:L-threonylcarbamoyladenylate synthase